MRVLFGLALLGLVFWWVDLGELARRLRTFHPAWLVVLCTLGVFDRVLMAYKWRLLLRAGGVAIPLSRAVRLYFVGHLFGVVTPGAVGADAYRVTALAELGRTAAVVSTILVERTIGLAVIAALALVTLPGWMRVLGESSVPAAWTVALGAVLAVLAVGALARPAWLATAVGWVPGGERLGLGARVRSLETALAGTAGQAEVALPFTLLTLVEALGLIVINWLAALALGFEVSFWYFLCVMPLLHILVRLPVSFLGIGVQEGLFAVALKQAGYTAADGVAVSLLLRLAEILGVLVPASALVLLGPGRTGSGPRGGRVAGLDRADR